MASEQLSDVQKQAIDKLLKLLDVKTSPSGATKLFGRSHIRHKDIIDAFAYWIDQTKLVFGEPVFISQNQGLRDAGVDILITLVKSEIRFGIQIKSPGDLDKKGVSKEVNAQISQSHRHKLLRLVTAFAGDLTNPSHAENS